MQETKFAINKSTALHSLFISLQQQWVKTST